MTPAQLAVVEAHVHVPQQPAPNVVVEKDAS